MPLTPAEEKHYIYMRLALAPSSTWPKQSLDLDAAQMAFEPGELGEVLFEAVRVMRAEDLTPEEMAQALRSWSGAALLDFVRSG